MVNTQNVTSLWDPRTLGDYPRQDAAGAGPKAGRASKRFVLLGIEMAAFSDVSLREYDFGP